MKLNDIAEKKAYLLSKATIQIIHQIDKEESQSGLGNIIREPWIFLRLTENCRIRMKEVDKSDIQLRETSPDTYIIWDSRTESVLFNNVTIEHILAHAPEQLFFILYKKCQNQCLFCPLTYYPSDYCFSWENIYKAIEKNKMYNIKSVSFSTSYPDNKSPDELVEEIVSLAKNTRNILGKGVLLGASVKTPSERQLLQLKESGIDEIRLNLETFNQVLAKKIMPYKNIDSIIKSIEIAVDIFGKNKVSSNLIIGLGESDNDILNGVSCLADLGAIATLYPYDPVKDHSYDFKRPSPERILYLAQEQNKIFKNKGIDPTASKTMCCGCAASHLYPGKDFV